MKIAIVGDWTYQNYSELDSGILNLFSSSDFLIYNFETAIDFGGTKVEKAYSFSLKKRENIFLRNNTICHLANNHLNDLGEKNAFKTIDYISTKGLCIGVISETLNLKPYVLLKIKNEIIAVLGCSEIKCYSTDFSFLYYKSNDFFDILEELHEIADKIILSIHWGDEQNFIPSPKQQKFAKKCIDKYVDLFIGHHSHIFQPYEKYKNKSIFYSIGNFQIPVTANTNSIWQKYSSVLLFDSLSNIIVFNPIYINESNPILLETEDAKAFFLKLYSTRISAFSYYIYSISDHYSQNWEAWKLRLSRYGTKEIYHYFKFICRPKNFFGMLNYVFLRKFTNKYSPLNSSRIKQLQNITNPS